jgi:hypothetical protein
MNEFTTVYDLTSNSAQMSGWFHFVFSMALIIGGISGVIFYKRIREKLAGPLSRSLFGILVLIGIGWWLWHVELFNYAILRNAKNIEVAEGIVHVIRTQPYQGHTSGDKITIDGQPFEIDYFHANTGYNESIAHGGVLKQGAYARIHHCDGVIYKVEVLRK